MKKILPYIFTVLAIANIFAPFAVQYQESGIALQRNIALAGDCQFVVGGTTLVKTSDGKITLTAKTTGCAGATHNLSGILWNQERNPDRQVFEITPRSTTGDTNTITFIPGEETCSDGNTCAIYAQLYIDSEYDQYGTQQNLGISHIDTEDVNMYKYSCADAAHCNDTLKWKEVNATTGAATTNADITAAAASAQSAYDAAEKQATAICNSVAQETDATKKAALQKQCDDAVKKRDSLRQVANSTNRVAESIPDALPACGTGLNPWGDGTIMGCIGKIFYYVLFVPTSFLFAMTGKFFDATFAYSVNSTSYQSSFITQGWAIVRDFCNMFFIFVLLYIAFSTILEIHGFNTKQMIMNVVIIGVLINFSMFAAQVIIDASNILARVFYNSDAIHITQNGANGVTNATTTAGANGELKLSEAIVNQINPQNLIINGRDNVIVTDSVGGQSANASTKTGELSTGAFILITLLATAVNVVGMIVFLSVGLIFVSRVIGLWFSMIFAPLAFFSYTVPSMQGIDMIGWKKWWPDLLSMSFLAPIFIFFLYLIIKFLSVGLAVFSSDGKTGADWVLGIVIPFAFIMLLMWTAKKMATKLSGTMGQMVTGGIAAVGGLALGGAALGGAALGRGIGGVAARASRGETLSQKFADPTKRTQMSFTGKAAGWVGSKMRLDKVYNKAGKGLNDTQHHVEHIDHARNEMDAIKDKAHLKGIADNKLTGNQEAKLKETYTKEKKSAVEADLKKTLVTNVNGKDVVGESGFKAEQRENETNAYLASQGKPLSAKSSLTDNDKKNIEDKLTVAFNAKLDAARDKKISDDFQKLRSDSREKVSIKDRAVSQMNTGSWHVGNLSQVKSDSRESVGTKLSTGLTSFLAGQMRNTLMKQSGVNYGSGQKDFMKDLTNTISEAMKSASVKIEVGHGGGGGHDDHGGGHDDHGGGGHH